jgi:hypothetical protein
MGVHAIPESKMALNLNIPFSKCVDVDGSYSHFFLCKIPPAWDAIFDLGFKVNNSGIHELPGS